MSDKLSDEQIRELADDTDSGRTNSGKRLFSDRNLLAFARALLAASPEQAISESEWLPIETAPKDGSEVALLFAREFELSGRMYSRVRAASWIGDWSIPYSRLNPPIGWNPMPAAPVDAARKGEKS